jgi:hypothetical protein
MANRDTNERNGASMLRVGSSAWKACCEIEVLPSEFGDGLRPGADDREVLQRRHKLPRKCGFE